jgi:hypothetical protein
MFSVIFEVHPRREQWDAYLDNAKMLRPELVQVDYNRAVLHVRRAKGGAPPVSTP